MGSAKTDPVTPQKLAENLAAYAIDRNELKLILQGLPDTEALNKTTIEYELQLLKIITVGWAISFYMPDSEEKQSVAQLYWEYIREISKNISSLTETTTGTPIDYFMILKDHLDMYVDVMQRNSTQTSDPSAIMGPAFAKSCQVPDDPVAILAGTKMFTLCLGGVKAYLDAVELRPR